MKCSVCGKENLDEARFCVECGSKLTQDFYQDDTNYEKMVRGKSSATTALVLGIISVALPIVCWCLGYISAGISLICGIIGLVFGIGALKTEYRSKAQAGVILSAIGIILAIVLVIVWLSIQTNLEEILKMLEEYQNEQF